MGLFDSILSPQHLIDLAIRVVEKRLSDVAKSFLGDQDLGATFTGVARCFDGIADSMSKFAGWADHAAEVFTGLQTHGVELMPAGPPPRPVATAAEMTLENPTGSENADVTSSAAA